MRLVIQKCLLGVLLGTAVLACAPQPAKADPEDRYWRHYWGWYDNTYRPYYHRRYYLAPPTYYPPPPAAPYYGGTTTYYGPAPAYPYGGTSIIVGPTVRYGWW
jgi:hypothetical protein